MIRIEMFGERARDLVGGGEVNEPIPPVGWRAQADALFDPKCPLRARQDLENPLAHAAVFTLKFGRKKCSVCAYDPKKALA